MGYNNLHWDKQLSKYLAQDWSNRPSPFVMLVEKYTKPHSIVLELGAGAGQDGLWLANQGHLVTLSDGSDTVFKDITDRAQQSQVKLAVVNLEKRLPFEDESFDVVYAQLVLHYFDDLTTSKIMGEIHRVLKPEGLLACMVNSIHDPEYDSTKQNKDKLINVDGLLKRYFNIESFKPFVKDFESLLFNEEGRTPKDEAKGTSRMVQFIGRKTS